MSSSSSSSLHPPIFRQASHSPPESVSLTYSVETESSSGGIETWLAAADEGAAEILWQDQSMPLFRLRPRKSAPKATMSYPPKTSLSAMSYEKYRRTRNHPPVSRSDGDLPPAKTHRPRSTDSSTESSKPQSVSPELAAAWMQMGATRRQSMSTTDSLGGVTSLSSSSSLETGHSSDSSSASLNQQRGANRGGGTRPIERGAQPRPPRASTSLAFCASQELMQKNNNGSVRDSISRDSVAQDPPSGHSRRGSRTAAIGTQDPRRRDLPALGGDYQRGQEASRHTHNNNAKSTSGKRRSKPPQAPATEKNRRSLFRLHKRENRAIPQEQPKDSSATRLTMTATTTTKSLWRTATDPASGRTYYYHAETRETQWRKPMELASDAEREEMRLKEEQQRNFFAAMEANILKNLETGAVVESAQAAADEERTADFLPTRDVQDAVDRPGLIRTISSMDRQVLSELVKRQPSNRRLFSESFSSPTDVAQPTPLAAQTSSEYLTAQTKSLSLMEEDQPRRPGDNRTLRDQDDTRQSMGTFLSSLPDDQGAGGRSYLSSMGGGGSFYDTSADDLGITAEEMDELTQLACISDQMSCLLGVDKDNKDTTDQTSRLVAAASTSMRASVRRASATNLPPLQEDTELSDHSSDESPKKSTEDQAAERRKALENMKDNNLAEDDNVSRPAMQRRNTCGTIYVGSTMSAPDKDATIKCICGVFRAHILQSEKENVAQKDEYLIFNDLESQQQPSKFRMQKVATPSLDQITAFYRDVFRRSQMETDCIIISLIYVERLIRRTQGQLRPRSSNWRSILFSCMILASKVWDDLSMWNADFTQTCPAGVKFSLQRINTLEIEVLSALSYDVKVPASEYAKYYFLLRSMLIKSGLGSETLHAMNPLDIEGAMRLQQMSTRYQASQKPSRPAAMSRSVSDAQVKAVLKAGLEHMVEL